MPSQVLPRIVGIEHSNEMLDQVKKFVNTLPPHSQVGIESAGLETYRNYPLLTKYHYNVEGNFWLKLAKHAESKGHKIIWIEKPSSANAGPRKRLFDELEKVYASIEHFSAASKISKDEAERNKLWTKNYHPRLTSYWRSKIMAELIQRTKWKPSDVIITGVVHAQNLSELLQRPIHKYILPPYKSENSQQKAINRAIRSQKRFYSLLQIMRKLNKRMKIKRSLKR
ncbi:Uncharacterised protein [uncultured archaeon]|nr:Uncharacterised protein [uncultured archaeon]